MKIKTFELNPLGVNTYILSDETNECVVIDAGCFYPHERELLVHYVIDQDLVIKHLICTHLHFDHILGVNLFTARFGNLLECHRGDTFFLNGIPAQLSAFGMPPTTDDYSVQIGRYIEEGNHISFGKQTLKVLHVPGHSPGSIALYHEESGSLFSGDALFYASIGRTDLPLGNYETLKESIRTKFFPLPPETVVYPGHGVTTTIGYEKKYNPFVSLE